MATEAPFRLPAKLNFDRIKAVLAAKRNAAEDHIWAMREAQVISPKLSEIGVSTNGTPCQIPMEILIQEGHKLSASGWELFKT
jgi:hypothetical protein